MGNRACYLWLCTKFLFFYKMWAEFAASLLNLCLSFLSPIAAAKSLLNKKADVKVRQPPDLLALFGDCTFFFFSQSSVIFPISVSVHVADVCVADVIVPTWLLSVLTVQYISRAPNVPFCLCVFMCLCLCQVWMMERRCNSVFSVQNTDLYLSAALFFPTFRENIELNHFAALNCLFVILMLLLHYTLFPVVPDLVQLHR